MLAIYKQCSVRIIDREFQNESGFCFEKTAIVTFYNEVIGDGITNDYGYVPTSIIYDLIDDPTTGINLDDCYIENFSLTAYRRTRILHKKDTVVLKGFSARKALFNSKYQIDFSYSDFSEHNVDFYGAYFLSGELNFYRGRFGMGHLDFNSAIFASGSMNFSKISFTSGNLNFKNIISSEGFVSFEDAILGSGDKNFSNTHFGGGEIKFLNVNFGSGKVHFKLVQFGDGNVDFHFSNFGNNFVTFESSDFGHGSVNFSKVEFGKGRVNFNRTVFGNGELTFEGAIKPSGKFTIKRARFGSGNINFEHIEMGGVDVEFDKSDFDRGNVSRVSFNRAKVKTLSLRSCHLDDYFDLRVLKCKYMDLSNTVVRDIIDLKSYDYKVDIETLSIAHMRLIGMIDIDWYANDLKHIINNKQEEAWVKADEFRTLKENFNKIGRYTDEDKAYVEFKRYEQKAILHDSLSKMPISAIWEYPYYCMKVLIFDKIGLYATNPVRVMISMIVAYVVFSLLYAVLSYFEIGAIISSLGGGHENTSIMTNSFYFSAITFLTVGYGDYVPIGCLRWISAIEGFVGVFLMANFTVAFVRKILR